MLTYLLKKQNLWLKATTIKSVISTSTKQLSSQMTINNLLETVVASKPTTNNWLNNLSSCSGLII